MFNQGLVTVIERYVKKGSKVYIEGQLETRKYTDKNGVDKYATDVVLRPVPRRVDDAGQQGRR